MMMLPAVQTALGKYMTRKINEDTGVHLRINRLQVTITGKIILKNFLALDEHKDTIFYGNRLQTYIRNPWRFKKQNVLKFGRTYIEGLIGKVAVYKGEKKSNLDKFIAKLDGGASSGEKTSTPLGIKIQQLNLRDSHFKSFNYNLADSLLVNFSHIQTDIRNFTVQGKEISLKAHKIQMIETHGIKIEHFSTDFRYNDRIMDFKHLVVKTPVSFLKAAFSFKSDKPGFKDFNKGAQILGKIDSAGINTVDLHKISPIFSPHKIIIFKTRINGSLNHLSLSNLDLKTGKDIRIKGNILFNNLLTSQGLELNANLPVLNFSFDELHNLFPKLLDRQLVENFKVLGKNHLSGQIYYGKDQLKTNLKSQTDLGDVYLKLNLKHLSIPSKTIYHGHIQSFNFKVKPLIHADFNDITANLNVKGQGLTLSSINANFTGEIKNLLFHGYHYQNINVNGDFKRKLFRGQFDVADKNLEMDFNGLIDFSKPNRHVDFYAEICQANLYPLNFSTDKQAQLNGNISVQANGSNIDDVIGKAKIENLKITNKNGQYNFKEFLMSSYFNDAGERQISFKSENIINGFIHGKFKFDNIPVLFRNAAGSVFPNYKIQALKEHQYLSYHLNIKPKLLALLDPSLDIDPASFIQGKIDSKDNFLKLKFASDKIIYKDYNVEGVSVRVDNKNPLYNTFIKIDSINLGFYKFKNFRLLNTTIKDTLYLKTKFKGGKKFKDNYDISFYYTMDQMQNFVLGFKKSIFNFKSIPWLIDPKKYPNQIIYNPTKEFFSLNNLILFHNNEFLRINGHKTKDSVDFKINLDSIRLKHILPDINDFDFDGQINGFVRIARYKKEILPSTVLKIKNFKLNNELLGDVSLKVKALPGKNIFIDLSIIKKGQQKLKLIGYIDLKNDRPKLNAGLLVNDFPVKPLQKLFKDTFANLRGKISGRVQINGDLANLSYKGKLYLKMFGLKIKALNVDYQFKDKTVVYLHDQSFELKDAAFYDTKYHTKGKISGVIKHHNFKNWYLDLHITTPNLLVLDTPPDPLEMFYGTVFTSGNAHIYGYVNKLKIDAGMKTMPNTNFVITLNDVETMGDNDFVRIISKKDYLKEKKSKKKKHKIYEGLEMNFDLDITPDAQVKILLDQEFGSTLVAKGTGGVLMEINTNGQFNIFGDFAVEEGYYNFKYGGFIDKKFMVEPGSYISWEGDPYTATLDIKAVYETYADPTVILAEQGLTAKKMPVEVIIYLKNKLIKPDISFDLELPKANAILKSQVDYLLSDPDKKTLQVLSLLSFGNFINENNYNLSKQAGETMYKTISETGLNILNSIMAQDDKFQVNLNYTRGDENIAQNIITDPQVGLSLVTQINKKVYINGKVAIPVGRYTKSSIVGDVELEVYLDKKGHLIFRVFNKQTELEYIGQQEGYTQGVGLSYQVDFDTLSDILKKLGIFIKKEPEN